MPPPADIYRLVADQQAAVAQLVAAAHALADAPIWIVGPGPVIDATLAAPQLRRGVSGVVMTSVASDSGSCSESFSYSDPGTGAPPKVEVRRVPELRDRHARFYRTAALRASGARTPPKPAPHHRGFRGREKSAASRKGAPSRRADQIGARRLK
jgi:hypothetical protein